MALAWSVLSVGQGPTSIVHVVFRGSDFSAAEAAGSLLLAWLCDGGGDTAGSGAGSGLDGAVAAASAGRGGSFSPRGGGRRLDRRRLGNRRRAARSPHP